MLNLPSDIIECQPRNSRRAAWRPAAVRGCYVIQIARSIDLGFIEWAENIVLWDTGHELLIDGQSPRCPKL